MGSPSASPRAPRSSASPPSKGAEGTKELDVDTAAIYRLAITLDISRTEK